MPWGVIGCERDNQQPLNMDNGVFYFKIGLAFFLVILAMPALAIASGHAHFEQPEPQYR